MSLRKIIVISTKAQPKEIRSEATTWEQLKDVLSSEFGDLGKMRAVVKETKATLELGDALLPDEDFTLYLTAKQIKAGKVDIESVLQTLKEKFSNMVNEILDEVENGEHNDDSDEDDEPWKSSSKTTAIKGKQASTADLEALKRIQAELG